MIKTRQLGLCHVLTFLDACASLGPTLSLTHSLNGKLKVCSLHYLCTLSALSPHSLRTLSALSLYYLCNISARSLHAFCTLSALSLHYFCTLSALSLYYFCTLSAISLHSLCILPELNKFFHFQSLHYTHLLVPRTCWYRIIHETRTILLF